METRAVHAKQSQDLECLSYADFLKLRMHTITLVRIDSFSSIENGTTGLTSGIERATFIRQDQNITVVDSSQEF
jgi:hypothetical protein